MHGAQKSNEQKNRLSEYQHTAITYSRLWIIYIFFSFLLIAFLGVDF